MTTAGHILGMGQRVKINEINLYFPSDSDSLTSVLSRVKSETSSSISPISLLEYSSFSKINSTINGLLTNYKLLLRNLNSTTENSDTFKNGDDQQLLSTVMLETELPLKKENQNSISLLSPKFSARYSPNSTKNNSNLNKSITYDSIFSLDRIDNNSVEGGESLTMGAEYSLTTKKDQRFINLLIKSKYAKHKL